MESLFSGLLEQAVPERYEKRKDWGKHRRVTVGIKADGLRLSKRSKQVPHGVWKHYVLRESAPGSFSVRVANVATSEEGTQFRLEASGSVDGWARAKVYQYGLHLVALEVECSARFNCRIQLKAEPVTTGTDGSPAFGLRPRVTGAEVQVVDFQIHRVSNADGPLVQSLSGGVRRLIQEELGGPELTAKLNRAIEKRQDRFELTLPELIEAGSRWSREG